MLMASAAGRGGREGHGRWHRERLLRVARHLAAACPPSAAAASGGANNKSEGELSYERALATFLCQASGAVEVVHVGRPARRIIFRGIEFDEFAQKLEDIDRSEKRDGWYRVVEGELKLVSEPDELPDWTEERRQLHASRIRECIMRGGVIIGAFYQLPSSKHQVMIGCAVLDGQWMGVATDTLDMYFLFASRQLKQRYVSAGGQPAEFRGSGIGGKLIDKISAEARARGAKKLYISAASGQNTIDFYTRKKAVLATERFVPFGDVGGGNGAFGGEDIHLVLHL